MPHGAPTGGGLARPPERTGRRTGPQASTSRRPSRARPSVSSSAYSRSPPDRQTAGDPGDGESHGLQQAGQVHGGGLTLEVGIGAEDHLGDPSASTRTSSSRTRSWSGPIPSMGLRAPWSTWYRPENSPVFSTATMSRGSSTTQTDRGIAPVVETDGAQPPLGHVEAPGAQGDALLDGDDGLGQSQGVLGGHLEEVEGDPLGRLGPHTGQPAELVDQRLQGSRVDGHLDHLLGTGEGLEHPGLGRVVDLGDLPELGLVEGRQVLVVVGPMVADGPRRRPGWAGTTGSSRGGGGGGGRTVDPRIPFRPAGRRPGGGIVPWGDVPAPGGGLGSGVDHRSRRTGRPNCSDNAASISPRTSSHRFRWISLGRPNTARSPSVPTNRPAWNRALALGRKRPIT